MRAFRGWLVFAGAVLLSGCWGRGDIRVVKDSVWTAMPDTTIGKALDSRSSCESTRWRAFDDERGRRIVEYVCEYRDVKAYLSRSTQNAIEAMKDHAAAKVSALDSTIGRARREVQELQESKQRRLSRNKREAAEDEKDRLTYQTDLQTLESMQNCRDFQARRFRLSGSVSTLQRIADMCARNGQTTTESYEREWNGVAQHFQSALHRFARAKERRDGEATDKTIEKAEAVAKALEEEKPRRITEIQTESAAEQTKVSARLKDYKRLSEISQWSIVNGEPVHVNSRVELQAGDQTLAQPVLILYVINDARDNTLELARRHRPTDVIDALWLRYRRLPRGT